MACTWAYGTPGHARRASEIAESERVQKGLEVAKDPKPPLRRLRRGVFGGSSQDTGKVVMEKTQQGLEAVKAGLLSGAFGLHRCRRKQGNCVRELAL